MKRTRAFPTPHIIPFLVVVVLLALPVGLSSAQSSEPILARVNATGILEVQDVSGTTGETIEVPVRIHVGDTPVSDYQFDLYFDTNALSYNDGDYVLGDPDQDWPVHDDNIIEPGHIRFGTLNYSGQISPGTEGVLVTFRFRVECSTCTPGQQFPLNLENLDGGIAGYTDVDGHFTYTASSTPTPTPTATPAPGLSLGTAFTYQGRLKREGRLVTGTCDFRFILYDAAVGGSQVGATQTRTGVHVSSGLFTVQLDFGSDAFDGNARWLEVAARCPAGSGTYSVLSPRQPITPVPYALYSLKAPWSGLTGVPAGFADNVDDDTLAALSCSGGQLPKWNGSAWTCGEDNDTTYTAGAGLTLSGTQFSVNFAGSGSADTVARSDHDHWGETWTGTGTGLTLSGGSTGLSASGTAFGVQGTGTGSNGRGVYGEASATSGATIGVLGTSESPTGKGVAGYAHANSGPAVGVYGQTNSTNGKGVYGYANATSGSAVGVHGETESVEGIGVYGHAAATSGHAMGVYGRTDSAPTGMNEFTAGVYGRGTAHSGKVYGVYGQSDSTAGAGVFGHATATSGHTIGVWGVSDSTDGNGVIGSATASDGVTYGVFGQSSSVRGYGVYGEASATSGTNFGVYGKSHSVNGYGVYGVHIPSGNFGALGVSSAGVFGESRRTNGTGVYALVLGEGVTTGVYARSHSTSGRGVVGVAYATSGATYGVVGVTWGTGGIGGWHAYPAVGVYGQAKSSSGYTIGVKGTSESTAGYGVYGEASATSGTNYGVYGVTNSPSGYAGYFHGDVHVTGDLSVSGSKSFKIDHPLDPANKYLYHFAQEAPQVQNVYNGVVTLDANGEAVVTLPDYFAALNTGPFRYQLTPIGAPMPNLYIAQEIQGNRFKIAGGVPGKKVSWEVTAVRNDPYLRDHPVQAEVDKPVEEKGTYLYPEGYGQPKEKGLDYQRNRELFEREGTEPLSGSQGK